MHRQERMRKGITEKETTGSVGPRNYGVISRFSRAAVWAVVRAGAAHHTSLQKVREWTLQALRPLLRLGCHGGMKQPWTKQMWTGISRNPTSHWVFPLPISPWGYSLVRQKLFSVSKRERNDEQGGPCSLRQTVLHPVCCLRECLFPVGI